MELHGFSSLSSNMAMPSSSSSYHHERFLSSSSFFGTRVGSRQPNISISGVQLGKSNNSRRKCATFKRHVITSILADVAKDFMTFQAPMFTKPEADPKTVASIILGGGAGTRLFPLTGRRAKPAEDPVIVKNIPYYKAKKALEAEVMKHNPPPRPENWGDLDLPLNASSWSEEDLRDPKKLYEMTVLLKAQREMADKILDDQWETKWRQEKLNEMLEEKVRPYIQNSDNSVLSQPILIHSQDKDQKSERRRRWWFF
ncbi:hypothetical protein LWI29_031889 [Acer saccharum]|uniref:Nucleotidyl transferase domain-containing protein n=1 Tax=Acer saccharum TaxID=4024 RepID=A0AA39T279_ACESA|nr:hypothetical protein LWI29_031889 [Acer saccharum]